MTRAEASRQYQLAVEHERRARRFFDGVLSGQDEIDDAVFETAHARSKVLDLMVAAAQDPDSMNEGSRPRPISSIGAQHFGREITLELGQELDGYGQFSIRVVIDGAELWEAHLTDKSDDPETPRP